MAIEPTYAKNLAANVISIMTNSGTTKVVPDDAQKMIEGYMARYMTAADRAAFLKAGKELDKIKGYPVLTELTWNLMGDACAAKAATSSGCKKATRLTRALSGRGSTRCCSTSVCPACRGSICCTACDKSTRTCRCW